MKAKLFILSLFAPLAFASPAVAARPRLPAEVLRALNAPSQATLYSLNPDPRGFRWFSRTFHDYRILGQLPLTDARQRAAVATAVRQAAQTYTGDTKCVFSPRHGVRVLSGTQSYDFVICFQCLQMEVYSGERRLAKLSIGGSPNVMNGLLRAAHITIAE